MFKSVFKLLLLFSFFNHPLIVLASDVDVDPVASVSRLAVIDSNIKREEKVILALPKNTKILQINVNDTSELLAERISYYNNIDILYIISHGSSGHLNISGENIYLHNINSHVSLFNALNASLRKQGEINIYACNVASGEHGKEFIQKISQVTNKIVYATDNLTGSIELGGDWELEYSSNNSKPKTDFEVMDYPFVLEDIK